MIGPAAGSVDTTKFTCLTLRCPVMASPIVTDCDTELFRDLQSGGADGFAVPAAFTAQTGRAHWEILVRARAIENLGYVLAAAQSGNHPGSRQTYGNSLIVDAWGEILGRAPDGEGVVLAQLDLQKQTQIRERFPALAHRIGGAGLATNNDHGEK